MAYITGHPDVDKYLLFKMLDYKTLSILNSANKYAKRNLKRMGICFEDGLTMTRIVHHTGRVVYDTYLDVNQEVVQMGDHTWKKSFGVACEGGMLNEAKMILNIAKHTFDINKMDGMNICYLQNVCYYGKLNIAEWLRNITIERFNQNPCIRRNCFDAAVVSERLNIMQWLHRISNDTINEHIRTIEPFLTACECGRLGAAKWLHFVSSYVIEECIRTTSPFKLACNNGELNVARWLHYMSNRLDHASGNAINEYINSGTPLSMACHYNYLSVAKWLWHIFKPEPGFIDSMFYEVLRNGHLKVAKWLWRVAKNSVQIHSGDELKFRVVCSMGRLDMAKWICRISNHSIVFNANTNYIKSVCFNGHLHVLQWLWFASKHSIDIRANNDASFEIACRTGNIETASWLWRITDNKINIQAIVSAFAEACRYGHNEIAQWLWEIADKQINIDVLSAALNEVCLGGNLDLAQWLWNISDGRLVIDYETFRGVCANNNTMLVQLVWKVTGGSINVNFATLLKFLVLSYDENKNVVDLLLTLQNKYRIVTIFQKRYVVNTYAVVICTFVTAGLSYYLFKK